MSENPLLDVYLARLRHMREHPEEFRYNDGQPDYWPCWRCTPTNRSVREEVNVRSIYSWAVPDDGALELIARYSPNGLVEIGAGTGYWANLLAAGGVDVVAYDQHPPPSTENGYHKGRQPFYDVRPGGPLDVKAHPERTLFLCWPVMSDMAYETARAYQGDTIIYIGEGSGGCNADDAFFAYMDEEGQCWACDEGKQDECWRSPTCDQLPRPAWEEIDAYQQPQWWGLHDSLVVYRRKV